MAGRELTPRLYDLVQFLAGARLLRRRLSRLTSRLPAGRVADLGGGTGWSRELLPETDANGYVLLEMDLARVADYMQRHAKAAATCSDARRVPLAAGSVDRVHFFLVAHHLHDDDLAEVFAECRRILRPQGTMIFCDPLWRRWWPTGRLLWAGDRGEHPRSQRQLLAAIGRHFEVETAETFVFLHHYLLAVARPRS